MFSNYENITIPDNTNVSVFGYKNLKNLPHWHLEHELIYIEKGSAEIVINNNIYHLSKGMSIFIFQESIHNIKADNDSEVWIMKMFPQLTKKIIRNQILVHPYIQNDYNIRKTMLDISFELNAGMEYFETITDCEVKCLMAKIFRGENTMPYKFVSKRSTERFRELLEKINSDYANIDFNTAAEFMCFAKPYFSKFFQDLSGMTFTQYLNTVRISAAIEMLGSENKQIAEIAFACGFGTIRSFNRIFKSLTGFAPSKLPSEYTYTYNTIKNYKNFYDPTLSGTQVII